MTSYKEIHKSLGLLSTRQQEHTIETIHDAIVDLRKQFPKAGAWDMTSLLFHCKGMSVSRYVLVQVPLWGPISLTLNTRALVVIYFHVFEPKLVSERKVGRLKRRRFWAAGINDILAVDQHDKWKQFGLALHTGIDPFAGVIHWIKVWWTNSNPKLILSYYLAVVQKTGCTLDIFIFLALGTFILFQFTDMPLITQSDPGSENYGIANGHITLHHWHDPNLTGTIQHCWMQAKKNVKPEITWSQLRCCFTPGFENLLEIGTTNGWYDMNCPLDV